MARTPNPATLHMNTPPPGMRAVHAAHPATAATRQPMLALDSQQQQHQVIHGLQQEKRAAQKEANYNGVKEIAYGGLDLGGTTAVRTVASKAGMQAIGPIGYATSMGLAAFRGKRSQDAKLEDLTRIYLPEICEEFGIPPSKADEVTSDHLRWFAERPGNEQLLKEVQGIDQEITRKMTSSGAGIAGSIAAPLVVGAALTPFTGGLSAIAGIAVSMVGGVIASTTANKAVDNITGLDPNASGHKALKVMEQKLVQQQPIGAVDVLNVLKAGDDQLIEALDKQAGKGKSFEDLHAEAQARLLEEHHPELLDASHQLAYQINVGATLPTRLLTLDTVALSRTGAEGAHAMTAEDIMRGSGQSVLKPLEVPGGVDHLHSPANNIVPFNGAEADQPPSTSIATAGAQVTPMQGRQQQAGIGPMQASILNERAEAAREPSHTI